ncbi:MAG TPA: metal transporter [Flavobacterium sp.]|nr:metal transporter [Flavobacterium sp.]
MKKLILVMLVTLVGLSVQAQEKKNKNAKYDVAVNGNCEMCKKRIEKAAYSVKGVKSAQWHQDHQDLHLIIDETKCSVDDVHSAIAKAGHDTDKMRAKDEDYERLHTCCQYERLKQKKN